MSETVRRFPWLTLGVFVVTSAVTAATYVWPQLGNMLERETDLVNEAAMIARMSKNFEGDPDVLFPKVYPQWSSRTVMTMSFMDGVKISKKDALKKALEMMEAVGINDAARRIGRNRPFRAAIDDSGSAGWTSGVRAEILTDKFSRGSSPAGPWSLAQACFSPAW